LSVFISTYQDIQVVETYGGALSSDEYTNFECGERLLDENEDVGGEEVCYEEEDESGHKEEPAQPVRNIRMWKW
jgi:hypothetical protein